MRYFTTDAENIPRTSRKAAAQTLHLVLRAEQQFADATGPDHKRLAATRNKLPGVKPVASSLIARRRQNATGRRFAILTRTFRPRSQL